MSCLKSTLKFALGGLLLSGVIMLSGCRESYVSYSEDSYPVYDYYPNGDFVFFGDSDGFHQHRGDFDDHRRGFDGQHRDFGAHHGGGWSGSVHSSGATHSFSSGGHFSGGHTSGGHGGGHR